jgi:hypothetical protein
VTVTFQEGTVTLLPRRAPVGHSAPIRGETLTALPLMGDTPVDIVGRVAAFLGRTVQHAPAVLAVPGLESIPAIAVLGLTAAEAGQIGTTIGLQSLCYWDGRRAGILTCSPTY